MKLVLVAGMNPRVNGFGPIVRLDAGDYILCAENLKDSKMILRTHDYGREFELENGCQFTSHGSPFSLELRGGTEDYVNVFAEKINGSVTATTS